MTTTPAALLPTTERVAGIPRAAAPDAMLGPLNGYKLEVAATAVAGCLILSVAAGELTETEVAGGLTERLELLDGA